MTESENQKLDLIIKMIDQQNIRIDQVEKSVKEDRAKNVRQFELLSQEIKESRTENARQFELMAQERKIDRAEWKAARAEDRSENVRQFDLLIQGMKEDRAENKRQFESFSDNIIDVKNDLVDAIREEKDERRRLEAKVEKVYEARNQVTVSFSRSFAAANAFIAGVIAVIVSLFMGDRF